jgi:hypothetical protein
MPSGLREPALSLGGKIEATVEHRSNLEISRSDARVSVLHRPLRNNPVVHQQEIGSERFPGGLVRVETADGIP